MKIEEISLEEFLEYVSLEPCIKCGKRLRLKRGSSGEYCDDCWDTIEQEIEQKKDESF